MSSPGFCSPGFASRLTIGPTFLVAFAAVAFAVYLPCLHGGPISDDYGYLLNPWVTSFSPGRLVEYFDPTSQATLSLNNYAPLRPVLHGLQWRLFAQNSPAYHATSILAHAGAAWLLARLLVQASLPPIAAILGAGVFLVHPANVESVAWMSQLWSPVGLALGVGALLLQRRRPAAGLGLFVAALLARPTAVSFLPIALVRAWCWRDQSGARQVPWLAAWVGATVAVGAAELWVFLVSESGAPASLYDDPLVRLRTTFAIAGRYLAMAATGYGVSAFQEVPPALSWLDGWWLAGAAGTAVIAGRALRALARRREEAAWWAWAGAAFVPVSQGFAFLYPLADRYLYFILPGLIGGVLLAGAELAQRLAPSARRRLAPVAALLAAFGLLALGLWSHSRAGLWTSEERVLADAARHHPTGTVADLLAARRASRSCDVEGAIAPLERARARGWDFYGILLEDPGFECVRGDTRFQALLREFARGIVEQTTRWTRPTQADLRDLAEAHRLLGDTPASIAALERGLALRGPLDDELAQRLARARARLAAERRRPEGQPAPAPGSP